VTLPIKVPTDEKLYIVSFERNRGRRCFASETIGSTALASPSPGRLFSYSHTDDPGQRERADHPVGLFRLLYRLGVNDDCPIRLSAAKAVGVEPPPGVISSIDPPCGPRASDTQRAARATNVDSLEPRCGRRVVCHFCRIGSLPLPRELPCKLVALFDRATRKE